MRIGNGEFTGRNGFRLEGQFSLTRQPEGQIKFETNTTFYFGSHDGRGTAAPGFALFKGDPTGLPKDVIEPTAVATDLLRIAMGPNHVRGIQTGYIGGEVAMADFDTVILWCFRSRILLGVGPILPAGHDVQVFTRRTSQFVPFF